MDAMRPAGKRKSVKSSDAASALGRWAKLEADCHLPEVQAQIRDAIFRGIIRVVPAQDGRVRIIPENGPRTRKRADADAFMTTADDEDGAAEDSAAAAVPALAGASGFGLAPRH
jgi:hypothetical protein